MKVRCFIVPCLAVFVAGFMSDSAHARPVSYPGGWTLMQMNDKGSNALQLHYSPTARYSIGYRGEYFRDSTWQFHGAQVNYLVNRWNNVGSQANLYLKSSIGLAYREHHASDYQAKPAGTLGIAWDWETRRYFTSYENRYVNAGDANRFYQQSARIGIAPYIGDYGDIHTWLMLQVDHEPSQDESISITPLVRLFKGETLVEAGISTRKEALLNWVVRF